MAGPYPNIKNKAVDWSSVELQFVTVEGVSAPIVKGITGLDWNISRTGGYQYGTSAVPIRQKRGQVSWGATIKFLKEDWTTIKKAIGDGYGEIPMNITGLWKEGDFESDVYIEGATILGESESTSEDGSPEVTIELQPMKIVDAGVEFLKPAA